MHGDRDRHRGPRHNPNIVDVANDEIENGDIPTPGGPEISIGDMKKMPMEDLMDMAKRLDIENYGGLKKQDLIFRILQTNIVNAGSVYGESDEHGIHVGRNPVHVHDFHATILHLMGLDHERLTYRHTGRDYRLTDVSGEVVRGLIA